ncbi:nucleoside hydrolase [Nocardia carnea]|uniref:nucleoside hydrolase n=1 Tax=Nocardia carnea TaxID=37328 RepID=UPI002455550D|nr:MULTISPECIES: nucleoside hydrolase [Nocardia]
MLDTDIGWRPGSLVALVIAACVVPNLAVVTADETRGRRARLARHTLDALGRPEVRVVAGFDLGGEDRFLLDNDHSPSVAGEDFMERIRGLDRMIAAVVELCDTARRVQWAGLGPMSNLAAAISRLPEIADRVVVTQLGGALDRTRGTAPVSDNFRVDPTSAGLALRALHTPRLVLSDHTDADALQITPHSPILQKFEYPTPPEWADLAAAHLRAWSACEPRVSLREPLVLSAALGLPFVSFHTERIEIHPDARLSRSSHGRTMQLSSTINHRDFMTWMHNTIE